MGEFTAEHKALEVAFQAGWAAHQATYPAAYANVPFTPPASSPWLRFTILSGEGNQIELGEDGMSRFPGALVAQIFVPKDTGERTARAIADLLDLIFKRQSFQTDTGGRVVCETPSFITVPATDTQLEKDGWEQFNWSCPYRRDE
jgi:hypothetical protein